MEELLSPGSGGGALAMAGAALLTLSVLTALILNCATSGKKKSHIAAVPSEAAPKKLNSYMRFCAEQRKIGPASAAELGARWRGLSDTQKTQFASAP